MVEGEVGAGDLDDRLQAGRVGGAVDDGVAGHVGGEAGHLGRPEQGDGAADHVLAAALDLLGRLAGDRRRRQQRRLHALVARRRVLAVAVAAGHSRVLRPQRRWRRCPRWHRRRPPVLNQFKATKFISSYTFFELKS